jgi:hypothetical protein
MLRTARSGRAVRFPAIIRMGENCASCVSDIKSWTDKDCITCILCGSKENGECGDEVEQEFCRSPAKIFLFRDVFNIDVENFVQKRSRSEVNLPFFNTLIRFAQFLCNEATAIEILSITGPK